MHNSASIHHHVGALRRAIRKDAPRSVAFDWGEPMALAILGESVDSLNTRAESRAVSAARLAAEVLPALTGASAAERHRSSGATPTYPPPETLCALYPGRTPAAHHGARPDPSGLHRARVRRRDRTAPPASGRRWRGRLPRPAMRRPLSSRPSPPCGPCPLRRRRRRSPPLSATRRRPSGSVAKSGWLVTCLRDLERGVEA